jgi:predicted O-methyltransferase YrrM
MTYLPSLIHDKRVLTEMVEVAGNTPDGAIAEVGVYQGGSASYLTELAEKQGRQIFLYDTFEGMPVSGIFDKHPVGDFADTSYEVVRDALPYATVVKGFFPDSVVPMPDLAFVHIDVDQYQCYVDCINYFRPRMVKGGIMWFDDYELKGAQMAVDELIGKENTIAAKCGHHKRYTIF